MKPRKIPLRKCTGCGEMKPKKELIRVVKAPDVKDEDDNIISAGEVSLDFVGKKPGRGAYVCHSLECLRLARKGKRLERAFSCKIPDDIYNIMEQQLAEEGANQ